MSEKYNSVFSTIKDLIASKEGKSITFNDGYERIGCSKGNDFNKGDNSVKCMIFGYHYFQDIGFKFQPYVSNACHDFSMTIMDLSDFFILNIEGVDYRVYISGINKKEAVNILKNSVLGNKGVL